MEIDPDGGTNYTVLGSSELLSVPYALYAEQSGSSQSKDASWSLTGNIGIDPTVNFMGTIGDIDVIFNHCVYSTSIDLKNHIN